jgi:hypothetical protein
LPLIVGAERVGDVANPGRVIDLVRVRHHLLLCAYRSSQRDVQVGAPRLRGAAANRPELAMDTARSSHPLRVISEPPPAAA